MTMPPEIVPPTAPNWRLLARTVIEALAQFEPTTAALVTLYRFSHPSQLDAAVEAWRRDVGDRLNDHAAAIARLEDMLRPHLRVTEQALALGLHIARKSTTGLRHPAFDITSLAETFADMPRSELLEAVAELEHLGMLDVLRTLAGIRQVNPLPPLFATFDRPAHNYDTIADAVLIASLLLDNPDLSRSFAKLDAAAALPRRRFNPAAAMLLPLIHPGHVSKTLQPDYPAAGFFILDEDRFKLRQFVRAHSPTS